MNQLKKILITTGIFPPDIGGPASYAEALATELSKSGVEVCVLSYSKIFNTGNIDSKYQFKVVRVWGSWPIWLKHLIFGLKVLSILKKYDAVLALNVWSAGFPSFVAAKVLKKKFYVRVVGDYAWEVAVGKNRTPLLIDDFQKAKKSGWIGLLYKLQSWICRKSDKVIVPSEYLAGIVAGWNVPRSKINIIYNGVDFKPADISREEARKKIGIHGNIIISIGRLVPWKGFRMLIKIMPQLLNINQFFRLVIVGDGPDRRPLDQMVKNLGLDRKVFLVGKKSRGELAEYLAASDIFVLNTGYEGFSHQILEAMSAGTPVITTAVGGNKEVMHQGENGFMVKYNDEFNIIEAIKSVWQNPDLREEFVVEGKKTAVRFSVEKMLNETIKVFTE